MWSNYKDFIKQFNKDYFNGLTSNYKGYSESQRYVEQSPLYELLKKLINKNNYVLEVGAAKGFITKRLIENGYQSIGIDVSKYIVPLSNNRVILSSVTHIPFKDKTFDLVLCENVLEHIPYQILKLVPKELYRVCKSKIVVTISLLNDSDAFFDKTHITLKNINYWLALLSKYFKVDYGTIPNYPHVIIGEVR